MIDALPQLKGVSTISNINKYNLLTWKQIEQKLDIYLKYPLHNVCFIFEYTAFFTLWGRNCSNKEILLWCCHKARIFHIFMIGVQLITALERSLTSMDNAKIPLQYKDTLAMQAQNKCCFDKHSEFQRFHQATSHDAGILRM